MGSIWLHDLPEVLGETSLDVLWWPGWETRSRSSGGYDKILAVQCHHDASGTSWTLEQGMAAASSPNNPDRPVGALWLGRDGRVGVLAAGATNTSGRGWALGCSKGIIPTDAANRYVIAIEAMNNGVGEVWPSHQTEAYRILCASLVNAYDLNFQTHWADLHGHYEYTDRKIDPAGPPYAKPGDRWLRWDMNRFRKDVSLTAPGVPPMATLRKSIRLLDTRATGQRVPANTSRRVGTVAPPAGYNAAIVKIGVAQPSHAGFIAAWDGTGDKPNTSVQDFEAGAARGNLWHVALSQSLDGGWGFSVYSLVETDLIVDLVGWDVVI